MYLLRLLKDLFTLLGRPVLKLLLSGDPFAVRRVLTTGQLFTLILLTLFGAWFTFWVVADPVSCLYGFFFNFVLDFVGRPYRYRRLQPQRRHN